MDKIITFLKSHKNQIKWAAVGVLCLVVAYLSVEALVGLVAIFFGSQVHPTKKQQQQRKERIKDVVEQQVYAQAELDSIRQELLFLHKQHGLKGK